MARKAKPQPEWISIYECVRIVFKHTPWLVEVYGSRAQQAARDKEACEAMGFSERHHALPLLVDDSRGDVIPKTTLPTFIAWCVKHGFPIRDEHRQMVEDPKRPIGLDYLKGLDCWTLTEAVREVFGGGITRFGGEWIHWKRGLSITERNYSRYSEKCNADGARPLSRLDWQVSNTPEYHAAHQAVETGAFESTGTTPEGVPLVIPASFLAWAVSKGVCLPEPLRGMVEGASEGAGSGEVGAAPNCTPAQNTKIEYWIDTDDGRLRLRTQDGEAAFLLSQNGRPAKTTGIFLMLCKAWPECVKVPDLIREFYADSKDEPNATEGIPKKLRSLLNGARAKLKKAHINPEILPALTTESLSALQNATLTLNVAKVRNVDAEGHKTHAIEYDDTRPM